MLSPWLLLAPGIPTAAATVLYFLWRRERNERGMWQHQALTVTADLRDERERQQGVLRVIQGDFDRDRKRIADRARHDAGAAGQFLGDQLSDAAGVDDPALPAPTAAGPQPGGADGRGP